MNRYFKLPPLVLTGLCVAVPALAHDKISTVAPTAQDQPSFGKDQQGNVYFTESFCVIDVKNAATGVVSTFAGRLPCGYSGDGGPAIDAQFNTPTSMAFDAKGNAYVADANNCALRRIDAKTHIITTFAGGNNPGSRCSPDYEGFRGDGDGGPASAANLFWPANVELDGVGNIYIADQGDYQVREIFAGTGIIDSISNYGGSAGYIGCGFGCDGPAQAPVWVDVDANGNLFIADDGSQVIWWHTPSGALINIAGIVTLSSWPEDPCPGSFYGDGGPALDATFNVPTAVVHDKVGNLYVVDSCNGRIREISAFPGYGLSTTSLRFAAQKVGSASAEQTIVVGAIGPTKIDLIVVSDGFTETDNCDHTEMVAGQACQIRVSFDPKTAGAVSGRVRIYSNAFFGRGNPDEVALSGVGTK